MTKKLNRDESDLINEIGKLVAEQKKQSTHAKKQNLLSAEQLQQNQLKMEQTERLYLLEKSKLQPKFKLSVTEFLLCEPDFMADPEQASEAKFLTDLGIKVDERVLRFQVSVVEKGEYLRPRLVIKRGHQKNGKDLALCMNERLYFLSFNALSSKKDYDAFDTFWVYQDQTTLPVLQKFHVSQQKDSKLTRWNAAHQDTVYALAKHAAKTLNSAKGCSELFGNRF